MVAGIVGKSARIQARGLRVLVVGGGVSQRTGAAKRACVGGASAQGGSIIVGCLGIQGVEAALSQRCARALCGPGWGRHGQARGHLCGPRLGGIAPLFGRRVALDGGDGGLWRVSRATGWGGLLLCWSVVFRCGLAWRWRWRLVHDRAAVWCGRRGQYSPLFSGPQTISVVECRPAKSGVASE